MAYLIVGDAPSRNQRQRGSSSDSSVERFKCRGSAEKKRLKCSKLDAFTRHLEVHRARHTVLVGPLSESNLCKNNNYRDQIKSVSIMKKTRGGCERPSVGRKVLEGS